MGLSLLCIRAAGRGLLHFLSTFGSISYRMKRHHIHPFWTLNFWPSWRNDNPLGTRLERHLLEVEARKVAMYAFNCVVKCHGFTRVSHSVWVGSVSSVGIWAITQLPKRWLPSFVGRTCLDLVWISYLKLCKHLIYIEHCHPYLRPPTSS